MADAQNYRNHAKFVPLFHFVLLPLLLLNFLAMGYHLYQQPDIYRGWAVVMGLAFIVTALFARAFAIKAQDRVIRIEERMRLHQLLPTDLKARIPEVTTEQLIALRFASDEELHELAATVLRDKIQKRDAIKRMVKNWRADNDRV